MRQIREAEYRTPLGAHTLMDLFRQSLHFAEHKPLPRVQLPRREGPVGGLMTASGYRGIQWDAHPFHPQQPSNGSRCGFCLGD